MRSRKVGCMGPGMAPVQDDYCEPSSQPQARQSCKGAPCHYMWITGEWSQVGIKEEIKTELCSTANATNEKQKVKNAKPRLSEPKGTNSCLLVLSTNS